MKYLSVQRCLTALYFLLALATVPNAWAQTCHGFTTKTTADGLGSNYVLGLYVVSDTIYVATDNGLSISTNRGNTFTNKTIIDEYGNSAVNGVHVVGSTIYAATASGLCISTDGGNTFTKKTIADGLGSYSVNGVYVVGNTVYAATNGGLSISTDGGNTFTNRTTFDTWGSDQLFGVYVVANTIYLPKAGGLSISTDGGNTFVTKTTANGLGGYDYNIVRGVYVVGSTIYAATDSSGVSISTDGGTTFTNKTTDTGLSNNGVNGVYAVGDTIYAATYNGLSISTDGGNTFTTKTTTDGLGSNYTRAVYVVGNRIYVATYGGLSISLPPCLAVENFTATPSTLLTTDKSMLSAAISGGVPPYSYSFSGPGTISQTPTSHTASATGLPTGTQTFTVVVTDSTAPISQSVSAVVSVTTLAPAPAVTNPVPTQDTPVGQNYTLSLTTVFSGGPSGRLAFSAAQTATRLTLTVSGLPPGLTFTPPSTISGVPTTTGESIITVMATNESGLSTCTSFYLRVNPTGSLPPKPVNTAPKVAKTLSPQATTEGLVYTLSVASIFTDAETPNQLSLSVSGLPPGLRVTAPGIIAGTPSKTGLYTITVTAIDPGNLLSCNSFYLVVGPNTAPRVAKPVAYQAINGCAGYSLSLSSVFTDAETPDRLTLSVSGLPPGLRFTAPGTISGTPLGSGLSTITVTATDPGNLLVSTSFLLMVKSPSLSTLSMTAPIDPITVTTALNVSIRLTNTIQSATWYWGNGASSAGTITGSTVTGSNNYAMAGVYSVTVTVKDVCGLTATQALSNYIVVYDPSAGFVTGGGWINSPAGAYTANLTLKGKANFGFESKYQNGATVPTGTTDFQFNAAGFKFKSIVYDWLTVAGARAQYKGSGTVNGSGNYGFILTAIDGQINGGGNIDKFRIKIWDKGTGNALYDNQAGASDNGPVLTSIGGGSIVIHTGSKNGREASSVEPTLMADGLELRNYPNPIDDKTTIEFMLPQGGDYALLILDTRGSVVRQLQTGKAQAGQTNQISWEVGQTPGGLYITQLITGQGVKAIKLLVK